MNYPNGLDSFIDPIASNKLNNPSHSAIERAQNAALSALEAYVGVVSSTSPTSITYQLNHLDPSHITGVVPVSAGGTGSTSTTAGFDAISPLSALGDLLTFGPTSNPHNIRFPLGANNTFLRVNTSVTGFGLEWVSLNQGFNNNSGFHTASAGTITIPHGLGAVPKMVRISAMAYGSGPAIALISNGSYNGTINSCSYTYYPAGGPNALSSNSTTNCIFISFNGITGNFICTVDVTNIILTPVNDNASFSYNWDTQS